MDIERMKLIIFYSYLATITTVVIVLMFNFDNISVIHAWASPSLPIFKYETYSSVEILSFYILFVLTSINIISMKINRWYIIRRFIFIFTPLVSIVFILVILFNPHIIIILPTGLAPTQLDILKIGGIISIIIFANLTINSITSLWIERKC